MLERSRQVLWPSQLRPQYDALLTDARDTAAVVAALRGGRTRAEAQP